MSDIVKIGDATLYHGDCMEILPTLDKVDAVVTDPPYGIGIETRVNHPGLAQWDNERADPSFLLEYGNQHLFWGGQYFADLLPPSGSWLSWIKRPLDGITKKQTHTTIELAWCNWGKPRFKCHVWDGGKRQGVLENRTFCHPTQKPVEVMEWSLDGSTGLVCDPYMGSGTTGIACANLGRKFTGIELDRKYFDIACERIDAAYAQGRLFA